MASRGAKDLCRDLDLIAGSGTAVGLSDAELLVRFAGRRGDAAEAAFEAIVARHGPMVLGVCRGVLRHPTDADDAFQATFLVLVKKAGAVRAADSLGPWLYRVARRVAVKARSSAQKRRSRETSIEAAAQEASEADVETLDARPILFEELDRLPEKYRSPVVLCHLEGLSHEEAAMRLRWPVGTLSGRLSRARGLLRSRLMRRGLGVPAALGASVFPPRTASAVPPALLRSTVRSAAAFTAGGPLPSSILSLSQGVVTAMLVQKLKSAVVVGSALTMFAAAVGYASGQIGAKGTEPVAQNADQPKPAIKPAEDQEAPSGISNVFPQKLGWMGSKELIVVAPKDRRSITAMVVDYGEWHEYRAPEGVSISPTFSDGVLAFTASGDEVREVAAFCTSPYAVAGSIRGRWVRQALREPAKGPLQPVVGPGWAFYQVDGDVYAFSATTNSWATLHLDGPKRPMVYGGSPMAAVFAEQGDMLYVFSVARGEWSKGVRAPRPEAK